jgi:hypothetical protein
LLLSSSKLTSLRVKQSWQCGSSKAPEVGSRDEEGRGVPTSGGLAVACWLEGFLGALLKTPLGVIARGRRNALHSSRRHDPADLSEPVRRVIEALSRRRVNRWVVAEWTLHAVFAVQNRWLGRRHDPLMHPDLAERRRRNRHESIMLVKYVSGAAVWRVKDMGGLRGAARIKHRLALLTFL